MPKRQNSKAVGIHFTKMVVRLVFGGNGMCDEAHDSVLPLVKSLREKIKFMHNLRTEDIINFVDGLGKHWAGNAEIKKHVAENLNHLVSFMSKNNTKEMLNISLRGNYGALDDFVELSPDKLCHAQPRGLAVHWLSGNIQIIGIFSILQALLTKNVSLIKASSRSYEGLIFLLDTVQKFNTEKIKGADIASTMNVVLVEHDDKKNQRVMSMNADMRIVWGGAEAVDIISGLKKRFFCEDIIYGPKYSYALVDRASLIKNAADIARRFAFDISTFDQYACSSPHTIFIEQNSEFEPVRFAELLASELDKVNRLMIPKGKTEAAKVMDVLNLRTEYMIKGKVFSSKNAE